ncbi:hypothetical protein EDB67_10920 [Vibrio crassostreae]|uniref:hypothetical protein n=1 Tax=Vibrio crassostreae TaxID=246167 RepID=UPI000F488D27|nr:hypothetical protein [Vibrio crassostreae]ROR22192.1 hypothetical protein EDB67_10920 [Vibrio crassostreae]
MTYRNEVANLDGSQSYDPDNTGELTFSWDITSKPDGSNAVFSLTEEVAKFTPDLPGEYTIALTVNDGEKDSPATAITITAGTELKGQYREDFTTKTEDSPYLVNGIVQIAEGKTFTIDGVTVLSIGDRNAMAVFGNLVIKDSTVNNVGMSHSGGTSAPYSSIEIRNSSIDSQTFPAVAHSYGSTVITDSRVTGDEILNNYVWYPTAFQLERNVFESEVYLSIGIDDGVQANIKNNLFKGDLTVKSWAGYRSAIVNLNYNTFGYVPKLSLKGGDDQEKIDATENYWPTTDTDVIDEAITDNNDSLGIVGIIEYKPMLLEPHENTPTK